MFRTFRQHRMRAAAPLLLGIGATIGISVSQIAGAAVFELEDYPPASIDDAEEMIGEVEAYVEAAQCGGWKFETDAAGYISTVTGVPGRSGDPFALVELGMAKRNERGELLDDGFQFPDTSEVWGWTSACPPGFPPYYQDTAAQTPCENSRECEKLCARINRWQFPMWMCIKYDDEGNPMTSFMRAECRENKGNDPNRAPRQPANDCDTAIFLGWFYCCTGQEVTKMDYEDCREGNSSACLSHPDHMRNCIRCEGDGANAVAGGPPEDNNGELIERGAGAKFNETGCRVGRSESQMPMPDLDYEPDAEGRNKIINRRYRSFFRKYSASYQRQALQPEVREDNNAESRVPVLCFGRYFEFDPKLKKIVNRNHNCVIDIRNHRDLWVEEMRQSQIGKGDLTNDLNLEDAPYEPREPEEMNGTFWRNGSVTGEGDGGSVLNISLKYQRPIPQLSEEQPRSSGALLRAFDETIATDPIDPDNINNLNRTIVEWWQGLQTEANKLFNSPTIRVVIPPAWSVDLDPTHPLLSPIPPEDQAALWDKDPLQQPIEVQVELRDDLLGDVADFLESSLLLQIQQERVPIAVPMGSATEIRAIRESWCRWHKVQTQSDSCDDADSDLRELLDRLDEYANRLDEYRSLRAELSVYMAKYLEMHNTINRNIGEWILDNARVIQEHRERIDELKPLKDEWERVQQAYRKFHDESNFPWCRNDRFTTPIYSLLDPWMPGRPSLRDPDEELPRFEIPRDAEDLLFDITRVAISSGTVLIPVLEPIQVSFDATGLQPPKDSNTEPNIPKLPELPPIPTIADDIDDKIPEVDVGYELPPIIEAPEVNRVDNEEILQKMREARQIIQRMEREYAMFWSTLERVNNADELDCFRPNSGRCRHVEMDLMERFTRIGARPAILLKQDFESIGPGFRDPVRFGYDYCPKEDWVCYLLNSQEDKGRNGWYVQHPTEKAMEEYAAEMRRDALESSLFETINLQVAPGDVLPSFNKPVTIQLYPTEIELQPDDD